MALIDAHLAMILRYTYLQQKCENVFMYFTEGGAWATADAIQAAEAWWNDVKDVIRAMAPTDSDVATFDSVVCRELVEGGQLAEFAIPSDEREGTRGAALASDMIPSYGAGGIRFTVGTTVTRPGQKRFPFLLKTDVVGNELGSAYFTLLEAVGEHFDNVLVMGAPVATGALQPVVGGTLVSGFPTVYQNIIGHLTNTHATSQVSRKEGRGS